MIRIWSCAQIIRFKEMMHIQFSYYVDLIGEIITTFSLVTPNDIKNHFF
jgi:hypothetical protein